VVSRDPIVVLDGAQNKASALALASSVRRFKYNRLILVLGVSSDKDIKGILEALIPVSDSVVLTRSKITARALDPERIRKLMDPSEEIAVTSGVDEAMDMALSQANSGDMVLVTGSLFVVGEARSRYV
jgi:folylpolyglutamate synthase/dihydropteroate synthase